MWQVGKKRSMVQNPVFSLTQQIAKAKCHCNHSIKVISNGDEIDRAIRISDKNTEATSHLNQHPVVEWLHLGNITAFHLKITDHLAKIIWCLNLTFISCIEKKTMWFINFSFVKKKHSLHFCVVFRLLRPHRRFRGTLPPRFFPPVFGLTKIAAPPQQLGWKAAGKTGAWPRNRGVGTAEPKKIRDSDFVVFWVGCWEKKHGHHII